MSHAALSNRRMQWLEGLLDYAPAGKDRTLAMVANLRMNFERYLRFTWQETHHLDQSQKEHRQILDLCVARDVERACTLLRQHILGTGSLSVERNHISPDDA